MTDLTSLIERIEAATEGSRAEQQLDYGQVDAAHRIIIRALEAQGGE